MTSKGSGSSANTWLLAGFAVLLLDTVYLAAYATPSLFYFVNIGVHVVLGVAVAVAFARWLVVRRITSPWILIAAGLLIVGTLFGLAVVQWGATRPRRWLLHTHIGFSTAGAALLFGYLALACQRLAGVGRRRLALASLAIVVQHRGTRGYRAGESRRGQSRGVPHRESDGRARQHGPGRRGSRRAILPLVRRNQRRDNHSRELLPDQ